MANESAPDYQDYLDLNMTRRALMPDEWHAQKSNSRAGSSYFPRSRLVPNSWFSDLQTERRKKFDNR